MNLTSILSGLRAEQRAAERRLQEVKRAIKALKGLTGKSSRGSRRKLSAAGRARIAAAQRKRWAKIRTAKKK